MPIIFVVSLLLGTTASLIALRFLRPQFRFSWLIAVLITAVAWFSILLWPRMLPISLPLPWWRSTGLPSVQTALSAESFMWLYPFALVTLTLAMLLTAPAQLSFPNSRDWAVSLGFAGLGLLSILARDPFTLAIFWAAMDLGELGLRLQWSNSQKTSQRVIAVFGLRFLGIAILLLAAVLNEAGGNPLSFASMSPAVALWVIISTLLRLSTLSLPRYEDFDPTLQNKNGLILYLFSAASSLGVLSHLSIQTPRSPFALVLLLTCLGLALYAGWMWLRAPDRTSGLQFWILCLSSLALVAALHNNPAAATSWGSTLVLAGGVLLIPSFKQKWLERTLWLSSWSLTSLPFSLTAVTWVNQPQAFIWSMPIVLITQGFLLAGFMHHITKPSPEPALDTQPGLVKVSYPAGLGLLVLSQFLPALSGWQSANQFRAIPSGILASSIGAVLFWAKPRLHLLNPIPTYWQANTATPTTRWLMHQLRGIYLTFQRASQSISQLLEGEAGIMLCLLLLTLLVSLVVGRKP